MSPRFVYLSLAGFALAPLAGAQPASRQLNASYNEEVQAGSNYEQLLGIGTAVQFTPDFVSGFASASAGDYDQNTIQGYAVVQGTNAYLDSIAYSNYFLFVSGDAGGETSIPLIISGFAQVVSALPSNSAAAEVYFTGPQGFTYMQNWNTTFIGPLLSAISVPYSATDAVNAYDIGALAIAVDYTEPEFILSSAYIRASVAVDPTFLSAHPGLSVVSGLSAIPEPGMTTFVLAFAALAGGAWRQSARTRRL